jgi:hypothetical protein
MGNPSYEIANHQRDLSYEISIFILRNNLRVFLEIDFHLRNYFGQFFTLRNHLGGISRD